MVTGSTAGIGRAYAVEVSDDFICIYSTETKFPTFGSSYYHVPLFSVFSFQFPWARINRILMKCPVATNMKLLSVKLLISYCKKYKLQLRNSEILQNAVTLQVNEYTVQ